MTVQQWQRCESPEGIKNQDYEVRIMHLNGAGNTKVLRCFFRLKHKVDCDYVFNVRAFSQVGSNYWNLHFGGGVEPAYLAEPGAVYVVDLRVPKRLGNLQGAGGKVTPQPTPR